MVPSHGLEVAAGAGAGTLVGVRTGVGTGVGIEVAVANRKEIELEGDDVEQWKERTRLSTDGGSTWE